ncbi:MAG: YeiH family protein [Candidatus Eremiobacteraeota bacterium]|nr:YeiH family protein [Candidatus Eremiobacteraeota bacterium]
MKNVPGLAVCLAVAVVAFALGRLLPLVGGPVFAIVIGMILATLRKPGERITPGIRFASRQILQLSIIVLGANLSLEQIVRNGLHSLPVMAGTLAIVLVAAYFVGGAFGVDRDMRRLIGVGTAICGGSAIAALSTVIESSEADIAYAISTVFLFNIVAVLVFPPLGHLLELSQNAFGLWAGTAINDTSSVVAAGFVYGHAAGNEAVIVKLTRTTLIIPIVLFYAFKQLSKRRREANRIDWKGIVPWFILGFVAAALLDTFGAIPATWHNGLTQIALFLIVTALAGVGLSADFKRMREAGIKPLALGLILWILIATSSLALARVTGLGAG